MLTHGNHSNTSCIYRREDYNSRTPDKKQISIARRPTGDSNERSQMTGQDYHVAYYKIKSGKYHVQYGKYHVIDEVAIFCDRAS